MLFKVWSGYYKLGQVGSILVTLGQVKSVNNSLVHVISGYVMLCLVRTVNCI